MRRTFAALAVVSVGALGLASDAYGDGVAQVLTSKSIPEATVQVIDPESGTSIGGSSSDIRLAAGDIILFQFNYFPVPDKIVRGLQGYLTEYIPANTEVVGFRLIDENGLTVEPRLPGIAEDDCGTNSCSSFDGLACTTNAAGQPTCSGGTRDLEAGTIAQVYADTGLFFAEDDRLLRNPDTDFIRLDNGEEMNPEPIRIGDISTLLGASSPFHVHNAWDWIQVRSYGISNSNGNASGNSGTGSTPFLYGSPVAGPETFYRYEASEPAGTILFNDEEGPWNRIVYPGSQIGRGCSRDDEATCPEPGTGGFGRMVADTTDGWDLTPANPLPTTATALRAALGEVRVGRVGRAEVALRVLDTPLDPVQMGDVDCAEVFGGDTSDNSNNTRAKDNPWGIHLASPNCVFLRLKFDLDVDKDLALGGDVLNYTVSGKNLSLSTEDDVNVQLRFNESRQTFIGASNGGTLSTCGSDACVVWPAMTLDPSEEFEFTVQLEVNGCGQITNNVFADYSSTDVPLFTTQTLTICTGIGIPTIRGETSYEPTLDFATAGSTTTIAGEFENEGTNVVSWDRLHFELPESWTAASSLTLTCPGEGTQTLTCQNGCGGSNPEYRVNLAIADGAVCDWSLDVNVPGGLSPDLYGVDVQTWTSQTGFGGDSETLFHDAVLVNVGQVRSEPPVITCPEEDPILSTQTSIEGTTSEGDGTTIRTYFNLIERADGTSVGNDWEVTGFESTFGTMYGGLDIRATAQATGELESELSETCVPVAAKECSDGLDNDGDGLIDFPSDPGCSGPEDGDEGTLPACDDGLDNDSDGHVDYPDDPGCFAAYDATEDTQPACNDGFDNDGDGFTDFGGDADCTSEDDRTEITLAACQNGIDDDGDGDVDFPEDPGCHDAFDTDETDPIATEGDIRARMLMVFDTSGSMNWNTCGFNTFTGGDGTNECFEADVDCATCGASGCGNGEPDDSRLYKAKAGVSDVVAGFGEVEYSLMRFHQQPMEFGCPGPNASLQSGGWQGAGVAPCGAGFSAGDLVVGFSQENSLDLLQWIDNDDNYPGPVATPGFDRELRGTGTTPIGGSLGSALGYLNGVRAVDPVDTCRPYGVILLTDGIETCDGDPEQAATELAAAGFPVYVVGFAVDDPGERADLDAIAFAGDTDSAIFVDDETALSAALANIIEDTILVEVCDGDDNDCDGFMDEGVLNACGECGAVPAETCNGIDDDCDDTVDEGVANACGECGEVPTESCNGIDDDCDGPIDEGDVCSGCVVEPETCDNFDNDCDGFIDEMLSRSCGSDVGECTAGTETCTNGVWGGCTATGGSPEVCDDADNDCDGTVDQITRDCGSSTGTCQPGTELCTDGDWGECTGAVGPRGEICDGLDNDCNGTSDDGNPGGGGSCGTDIGDCVAGTVTCVDGELVCDGGTGPTAEVCDGSDNDCDGNVDEGIPTGASCGQCGEGVLTCVEGSMQCTGDRSPTAEICDGTDNNCDGNIDEGNPGGGAECGTDEGECEAGTTTCMDGTLICTGGTSPMEELCDGLDNDCDSAMDEGNPESGGQCGDTDVGECEFGAFACVEGDLVCVGATGPIDEICDGLDNNCDGETDEGDPEGGEVCGDDTGACETGIAHCIDGDLVCEGAVGPTDEVCNAIDDDCDGVVDDGIPVGAPCGTDAGECVPGNYVCREGDLVCEGGIEAIDELCDTLDNDCDGEVDEELPTGGSCGTDVGECEAGTLQCVNGMEVCVGSVPPEPEVCDCIDNDCDGEVDEAPEEGGSLCPGGAACLSCMCALPCADSEFGRCPVGRFETNIDGECYCVAEQCDPESCAMETVEAGDEVRCAPDDPNLPECVCKANECTFACEGVVCDSPTVCDPRTGRCVEDNCRGLGCPAGQLCDFDTFECLDDPCLDMECPEVCRLGECEPSCATVSCDDGERCERGECVPDLCEGMTCPFGDVCDPATGECVTDMCRSISCPENTQCNSVTGGCEQLPCVGVHCPEGQHCEGGGCELDEPPIPDGGVADAGPEEDAGTTDAGRPPDATTGGPDAGGDAGDDEDRILATGRGGCACEVPGPGHGDPRGGLALVLLGLVLALRRRRS